MLAQNCQRILSRSVGRSRIVCGTSQGILRPSNHSWKSNEFIENSGKRQFSANAVISESEESPQTVPIKFVEMDGGVHVVDAELGKNLLDIAHENNIDLEGACGGELACSTCHLVFEEDVYNKLPEKDDEEEDMLDLAWGLTDT